MSVCALGGYDPAPVGLTYVYFLHVVELLSPCRLSSRLLSLSGHRSLTNPDSNL